MAENLISSFLRGNPVALISDGEGGAMLTRIRMDISSRDHQSPLEMNQSA